ncbi:protein SSX1-like [Eubalaena glacialis]|uniref:protein SSX1-like n=1 Tax=Eubalaena glacialis TaxID=27606 RepID=UPI002A5A29CD|nr:protein SSX1-like [Eubalaena glacialis]
MNRGSSFAKSPREYSQKSENSKAFKDISKYFPKKEWADLGYSEKITYVYMKRNYDIMTDLDEPAQEASNMQERKHLKVMPKKSEKKKNPSKLVPATSGSEQAQKQLRSPGKANTSGQQSKKTSGPKRRKINVWTHRLRERKNLVVYEEISDPEEDD